MAVPTAPIPLQGFEHYNLFWEPRWQKYCVNVASGGLYVSASDMVITTVLGSCIAACIYDPKANIGGVNHFILPSRLNFNDQNCLPRYGSFAMELLIKELIRLGCCRQRLEVKLVGGADLEAPELSSVGQQNIDFVLQYLKEEALELISADLGGNQARKAVYFPTGGKLLVHKLGPMNKKILNGEHV